MSSPALTKKPKYLAVAEELREQIERNELKAGDRLPSFVEMRARYGVTSTTVERIYAHLEKDDLVVREQGRGTFVKERAARPVKNVIGISGVTIPQHVYFAQLLQGFRQVADEAGVELLLLNRDLTVSWEKVDGVLNCDTGFERYEHWRHFPPGMPCVTTLVGARGFTGVIGDELQGSYDLTNYLLELGHRRIGSIHDPFSSARFEGYLKAMREANIEPEASWIHHVSYQRTPERLYTTAGYEVMNEWLAADWKQNGCTALVTQNDDTAMGVIRALSEAGWRIPHDVSVAGFDGTDIGRFFQPQLTSVEVPLREIGVLALELLLNEIRGGKARTSTTILPTRVLPGTSTGKPPVKS